MPLTETILPVEVDTGGGLLEGGGAGDEPLPPQPGKNIVMPAAAAPKNSRRLISNDPLDLKKPEAMKRHLSAPADLKQWWYHIIHRSEEGKLPSSPSPATQRQPSLPGSSPSCVVSLRRNHGCSRPLIGLIFFCFAISSTPRFALARRIIIRSVPDGAKIRLNDDSQICKSLRHGATDGVAPCTFIFDKAFFDPSGGMFEDSKILGVPLQITISKEGYQTRTVTLTDGPHIWKARDIQVIERTYYFIKAQGFDVHLEKETPYQQLASREVRKGSAAEALADGERLYYAGDVSDAVQALDAAARLSTKPNSEVYNFRCMAQFQLQRYGLALKDCQEFARLVPTSDLAWTNTGLVMQAMGQDEGAIACFSKAIQLNPRSTKALSNRASSEEQLDRPQDALNDFGKVLAINPNDADTRNRRAVLFNKLGYYAQAERDATAVIDSAAGPTDRGGAFYERGDSSLHMRRYNASIRDFTSAMALNPHWGFPAAKRCEVYLVLHQLGNALNDCNAAVREMPNVGDFLEDRAEVYLALRRYADALEDAQTAAERGQTSAQIYDIQGLANGGLRRWGAAVSDFSQALQLDPTRIVSYICRAHARRLSGDIPGAWQDLALAQRLLSSNPQSPSVQREFDSELQALGKLRRSSSSAQPERRYVTNAISVEFCRLQTPYLIFSTSR